MENNDISGEIRKLKGVVNKIPKDRRAVAESLLVEIRFMLETLGRLREEIHSNGVVELFEQGKQKLKRESPALKSYNATLARYSLLYKQITSMLPKPAQKPKVGKDLLGEFINQGKNELHT